MNPWLKSLLMICLGLAVIIAAASHRSPEMTAMLQAKPSAEPSLESLYRSQFVNDGVCNAACRAGLRGVGVNIR